MTEKELELQKQEITETEDMERTRDCRCFVPKADIYEVDDTIVIVADMPGVDESSVDVKLEKNILTINGYVDAADREGYALTYAEYEAGDFQRSFKLSEEIDREKIEATIKDGVLRLFLPKSTEARTRTISVKAE